MDELELIEGCRRSDRAAQRAVYDLHADRVYRIALRITRDEQDAFDVAQETFVRAFEQIKRFDARSRLGTWLYRIATNEALQLFRRRDTERRHLRVVSEQHSGTTRPEADAARHEVHDALDQLSDEHRTILVFRYQEGLSYEEIAEILNIAPGTVASRLNRARAEIRTLLGGDAEETTPAEHLTDAVRNAEKGPAESRLGDV